MRERDSTRRQVLQTGGAALAALTVGVVGTLLIRRESRRIEARRREIAIRSALGARPRTILGLVIRQGLGLVALGLLVGAVGAVLAGRLAATVFFGVRPVDPLVLGGTAGALLAVAALASWLPARQATRVDPRRAMAEE